MEPSLFESSYSMGGLHRLRSRFSVHGQLHLFRARVGKEFSFL